MIILEKLKKIVTTKEISPLCTVVGRIAYQPTVASQGILPRVQLALHFTVAFSGQLLFLGKSA